ncbi:MAG: hypothetical protein RJQ09_12150 [Cyclobacteriaceae bacterium]
MNNPKLITLFLLLGALTFTLEMERRIAKSVVAYIEADCDKPAQSTPATLSSSNSQLVKKKAVLIKL